MCLEHYQRTYMDWHPLGLAAVQWGRVMRRTMGRVMGSTMGRVMGSTMGCVI